MTRLFFIFWIFLGPAVAPLSAQESFYPDVIKGLGKPHPEGNEFMRVNHMNLLLNDRDQTLRFGDRDIKYSLKGCVACHVDTRPKAQPIKAGQDPYFCAACHQYVAVTIDCFQCHISRPDPKIQRLLGVKEPDPDELAQYVKGLDK